MARCVASHRPVTIFFVNALGQGRPVDDHRGAGKSGQKRGAGRERHLVGTQIEVPHAEAGDVLGQRHAVRVLAQLIEQPALVVDVEERADHAHDLAARPLHAAADAPPA